ncbi:/ / hypothetical protein / 248808:249182 Forward [Candidatus Hepatoplasma crinochetorum]|uniref:ASCH domain-containing protein n=1 Tax=Candidatus Hepatoplasma crinochetorum TaxID=295596 RepID=A0A0G7ZMM6_9MOLU|nr:/ / hypothetical protein / 248808:249182 Forward [Candidatus Hepatoplasma crinochetorum]
MKILMSIHLEHIENIKNKIKKFEFRKVEAKKWNEKEIILLYVTFPISKIIGSIKIKKVHIDTPEKIWTLTKEYAGINEEFYYKYYKNKNKAIAYEIEYFREFKKPKKLSDFKLSYPPQSFVYIN